MNIPTDLRRWSWKPSANNLAIRSTLEVEMIPDMAHSAWIGWIIPMEISRNLFLQLPVKRFNRFNLASADFIGSSLDAPNHGHYTLWWARQGEATPAIQQTEEKHKKKHMWHSIFNTTSVGKSQDHEYHEMDMSILFFCKPTFINHPSVLATIMLQSLSRRVIFRPF